ncbi:MAG: exodeoxyribonuclease III, partial [Dehalococcoidia bacterium]|nr:exodeoxyribonuclease III [Dehalococcoidia bacterium]
MLLASWNVNSIRARLGHVLAWCERRRPELLALQETKVEDEAFPAEPFRALGYELLLNGQKGFHGVALLARGALSEPL